MGSPSRPPRSILGSRQLQEWCEPDRRRWRTGSGRSRSSRNPCRPPCRGGSGDGFFFPGAHALVVAVFRVITEDLRAARVPQLPKGGRLDLADPLAGEAHATADLLEGSRLVVDQPEAQLNHASLARTQGRQDVLDLVAEHRLGGGLERRGGVLVLDEVAQVRILFLANRRFERYRLLRDL